MPSCQHFEIQRLRRTSRAAGLGWLGDALLRQYILLYFEPFLSLLSPRKGQVPGWDLPRSPTGPGGLPGGCPPCGTSPPRQGLSGGHADPAA